MSREVRREEVRGTLVLLSNLMSTASTEVASLNYEAAKETARKGPKGFGW